MSNLKSEPLQLTTDREKDLLAEIGRLHLSLTKANKEIERLKGLVPPDDTSFLGKAWSLIAEKLRLERDALSEILAGLREKGIIDQHNRPLPLEGHHKDCGHGKDGWSLCTCDKLRNRDARQFSELMNDIDASTLTTPHVVEPKCSKCGDTGRITIFGEGIATPTWCTACPRGRPSPLAESVTKAFQTAAADAVRTTLDRGGTAVGEVQGQWRVVSKTCEHGNTECQKCGVGQPVPTIKTPEGKPLLPAAEFAAMQIEENKKAGLTECGFQRKSGRTTAMVLKALEFVKQNNSALVTINVHNFTMKKRIKELLKHYADESGVQHGQLSRVRVLDPGVYYPSAALIAAAGAVLTLRDNVFDDMKETKPTRDPRQDLKVGEHVRFEIEGIIKERQSAGIFQDEDGSWIEPFQYAVKDSINGMNYYVGYHQITKVIGKEK